MLTDMHALRCDDLWPTIRALAERPGSRRAAVAYVTSDEYIKFSQDDILVTDASDHAIASGLTSAKFLQEALGRGSRLYSLAGLHAKVMVLGDTAVIGSANISHSSAHALIEAAWVTTMSTAVGMVVSLVHQLVEQAEEIDAAFIRRILAIRVVKPSEIAGRLRRTVNAGQEPRESSGEFAGPIRA